MHRSVLVPSLLAAGLLLTACGDDTGSRAAPAAGTSTAAAPAPTTPPPAPAPTTPPTPAPEAAGDTAGEVVGEVVGAAPPTEGTPAPGTPAPSTPAAPAPQDVPAGYPAEVVSSHGAQLWGVYLATGSPDHAGESHAVGEAESFLIGQGFTGSGIGSVSCDRGAAEQLGLAPDDARVAVYFATAEQARQFVAAYEREPVGTALVTTYCLD